MSNVNNVVTRINNIEEWLELWKKCPQQEIRLGLLHTGLDLRSDIGDWYKLVYFYMDIADVHCSGIKRYPLSEKAFNVLCNHVFSEDTNMFALFVEKNDLLNKILWFFRPTEKKNGLVNLPHNTKQHRVAEIRQFLKNLFHICANQRKFTFPDERFSMGDMPKKYGFLNPPEIKVCASIQTQLVEILYALGMTSCIDHSYRRFPAGCNYNVIEDCVIEKLRELAMNEDVWLPTLREYGDQKIGKPQTINDVLAGGMDKGAVEAARLYICYKTRSKMLKGLNAEILKREEDEKARVERCRIRQLEENQKRISEELARVKS